MKHLIIDGSNLFYRNYHTNQITNKKAKSVCEKEVGGVYGFMNSLSLLMRHFNSKSVIVCWDLESCKRRLKIHPEYKQGRRSNMTDSERENMKWQLVRCREILECLPVKQLAYKPLEADDVIWYLSEVLKGSKVIVTSDRDLLQCVNRTTCMYIPKEKQLVTHTSIDEFIGFPREYLSIYKSLVGDNSDNVKGIMGIGPKKAVKVINEGIAKDNMNLNPEWEPVLKRNLALMELGLLVTDKDKAIIRSKYKAEKLKKSNFVAARNMLSSDGIVKISRSFPRWSLPFKKLK